MRIHISYNPKPKTDLDGIPDKNPWGNRLVRLAYKFTKSVTKTGSKMHEPKIYNKAVNDSIYMNK